ncbi:hypothetical protein GCM10009556_025170 [Acrocarpospora pleiomorpha]
MYGFRRRVADIGHDLDLRLHELVHGLRPGALTQVRYGGEHVTRILPEAPRTRVDELQLPFDAQSGATGWIELNRHNYLHSPSSQAPSLGVAKIGHPEFLTMSGCVQCMVTQEPRSSNTPQTVTHR